MKKTILLLLMLITISMTAHAINTDEWDVNNIKFYINDVSVSQTNLENTQLVPGDNLKLKISIENKNETSSIKVIRSRMMIKGIDDGSDYYEDNTDFDIGTEESQSLQYNYRIPNNVEENNYNLILEVKSSVMNRTVEETFKKTWSLDVVSEKGTSLTFEQQVKNILVSVNETCKNINLTSQLKQYTDIAMIQNSVDICEKDKSAIIFERDDYRNKFNTCTDNLNKQTLTMQGNDLKNQDFNNQLSQCNFDKATAKNNLNMALLLVLVIGAGFAYKQYKNKTGTIFENTKHRERPF